MKKESFVDAIIQSLKNPTRAAIFYQLIRKPELTATDISKSLDLDVDVVYYHLKLLKKIGLISEPRVVVKRNYIEKYYSLRHDFKERLLESINLLVAKEKELDVKEFREMIIALFSVVQSIISSSIKELKRTNIGILDKIREENRIESKIIFCSEEKYNELLNRLRHDVKGEVLESFDPTEKEYTIIIMAIPKLK